MKSCYVLVKLTDQRLKSIRLYQNRDEAYKNMNNEYFDTCPNNYLFRSINSTSAFIIDEDSYTKWYIEYMEII